MSQRIKTLVPLLWVLALVAGCAPEVGSEAWCADMKDKPKGEWTANETGDFARHCLLK